MCGASATRIPRYARLPARKPVLVESESSPNCGRAGASAAAELETARTFPQPGLQSYLAIGEFQGVMMRGGVLQVDLQEAHEPLFDLLAQKDPNVEGPLAVDIKILTRLGRTAGAARWPVGGVASSL